MNCFHCGRAIETKERIGFRDRCSACDRPVHVCRNCDFHDLAYNNQCRETEAPRQVEKERANFCEFFRPLSAAETVIKPVVDPRAQLDALFKKKPG